MGYFDGVLWGVIPLVLIGLMLLAYGSANVCSNWYVPVVCKKKTHEKKICLTFDDGPQEQTLRILDILNHYQAKATFFVVGKKAIQNKHIVKEIDRHGHLIGCHSYRHDFFFPLRSVRKIRREILDTNHLIEDLTGKRVQFFRPPFGVTNPLIGKALADQNMTSIGWSIRSWDTLKSNKKKIAHNLIKKMHPGDIILFHDTIPETAEVLKELLEYLNLNNFATVTIDELLKMKSYD